MRLLTMLLAFALAAAGGALAQPVPRAAIPPLNIDGLPASVRDVLRQLYDAAKGRPNDPAAVGRLAMFLHAYEQRRAAEVCYRIARELDPRSALWAYLSAIVHEDLGEHQAAAEAFRHALQLNDELLPARLRLADSLIEAGDLAAAQAEFAALVRSFPELAAAHYGLGRLSALEGDQQGAAAHYRRAVELAPQFGAAHYALALAYRNAGSADRAEPHLEAYRKFGARKAFVRDPMMEQVRAMRRTARDLLDESARLEEAGRLSEAIALQVKALDLDPTVAQAHVNLIALYGRTGETGKAEAHYRAALTLDADLPDAHYNYGVLLLSLGRVQEAAAAFHRTLASDPFHAAAHNNIAALHARARRYAEAAAHYREALSNDPLHPTARLNLGRVLMLLGKPREAAGVLTAALAQAERRGDAALAATIRKELQKAEGRL
jgi:tetratricopeptide (TPR) repeat protein